MRSGVVFFVLICLTVASLPLLTIYSAYVYTDAGSYVKLASGYATPIVNSLRGRKPKHIRLEKQQSWRVMLVKTAWKAWREPVAPLDGILLLETPARFISM